MNATSTYDLIYQGLSDEDRHKMQGELSEIIKKAVVPSLEYFQLAIGKAVQGMVEQVGFWQEWVEENNTDYNFVGVLQKGIWEAMLKTNPKEVGEWDMLKLVDAWREKFPEEFTAIVNSETERELRRVNEALDFERRCNRRD